MVWDPQTGLNPQKEGLTSSVLSSKPLGHSYQGDVSFSVKNGISLGMKKNESL